MMAKKMVSLYKLAQTSSAQKMWSQTKHPLTRVEECQARAFSTDSHSKGLLHPSSLVFRPPSLLRDVPLHVPRPMLVVSLLVQLKNH